MFQFDLSIRSLKLPIDALLRSISSPPCTTHGTNLLDLHKLRKDQIYFANKKDNGATELYSLFDFTDLPRLIAAIKNLL